MYSNDVGRSRGLVGAGGGLREVSRTSFDVPKDESYAGQGRVERRK